MSHSLVKIAAACALLPVAAHADIPVKIYAQELADRTLAENPALRGIIVHAAATKGGPAVIVASNIGRIGLAADDGDLQVIASGTPRVTQLDGGKHIEVALPLRDLVGDPAGELTLVWSAGAKADAERKSKAIAEYWSHHLINGANLMDAYPLEPGATTATHAQHLIDKTMAHHPEVTVLAMRGFTGQDHQLVLLGSTFGRHGKKADKDDLKLLDSVEPIPGVYSNGKRLGVDLAIHDKSGAVVGTMNVGYSYHGEDNKPLVAKAVALRAELEADIAKGTPLDQLEF